MSGPGLLEVFIDNWPLFLNGLLGTLKLAFIAVFFGTLLGALLAILQLSKIKILNIIAKIYVEVLRGTPILVQLYIFYFFLPQMIPALQNLPKEVSVIIALILNSSAYVSEVIRGGINAVDKGQTEAAKSLGMSNFNCMLRIIFPQAIKNILPSLGNEYIMMVKETSLASVLMVNDLMYVKTILANKFLMWQPMLIIAIIYLIVTVILSTGVKFMEKRLSVSD